MLKLEVYVSNDCWSCEETFRIVSDISPKIPELQVTFINMETVEEKPENVFAVPTYLLNGRVISLGNPTREELYQKLESEKEQVCV